MQLLSRVWLLATPWTISHQTPLSMELSRQEYWSGSPFPIPGHLPDPGIEPVSLCISCIGRQIIYRCTTWEDILRLQIVAIKGKTFTWEKKERNPITNQGIQEGRKSECFLSCPGLTTAGHKQGVQGKAGKVIRGSVVGFVGSAKNAGTWSSNIRGLLKSFKWHSQICIVYDYEGHQIS